jgi:hypothetical protein
VAPTVHRDESLSVHAAVRVGVDRFPHGRHNHLRHVAHGAHQHVRIEEPAERLELWTVSGKCSLQYLSAPSAVPYPFQTRTTMERMGLRQGQRAELVRSSPARLLVQAIGPIRTATSGGGRARGTRRVRKLDLPAERWSE